MDYSFLIKDKIKECYSGNKSLYKLLLDRFQNENDFIDKVYSELEDFILSNNEIYKSKNFTNLIFEAFLQIDNNRFVIFLRNLVTENPNRFRTYKHMLNDIEDKIDERYQIPKEYYSKSQSELNDICDECYTNSDYFMLSKIRNFINENFRVNDFNSFVNENRDLARKILKGKGLDETDKTYLRIRKLLEKKPGPGFIGWFVYLNQMKGIRFIRLKNLYERILKNKAILNLLPQVVTMYKDIEELEDDLTQIEEIHQAKIFANDYPSEFKKQLSTDENFMEIIKMLNQNNQKSRDKLEMYKKFFIKKVARYKDKTEILNALANFVYSTDENEKIRETINNNSNLHLVYDDDDLLVVRVTSYDAIQVIGNDTSWCIKDSLSYWTDYVGDSSNIQLVIINFKEKITSVKRKIGVTYSSVNYFSTAHMKNDNYINKTDLNHMLKIHEITLDELVSTASNFGSNEYYEQDEISSESYRGGF